MGSFRKQIRISLDFLALSFIQLPELQEAMVSRLAWMVRLLFLTSPSDFKCRVWDLGYSNC